MTQCYAQRLSDINLFIYYIFPKKKIKKKIYNYIINFLVVDVHLTLLHFILPFLVKKIKTPFKDTTRFTFKMIDNATSL